MKALENKSNTTNQTQSKSKSLFFGSNAENRHTFFSEKQYSSESFFQPSAPHSIKQEKGAIQCKTALNNNKKQSDNKTQPQPEFNQKAFHDMLEKSNLQERLKRPIAEELAKKYVNSIPAPEPAQNFTTYRVFPEPTTYKPPSIELVTKSIVYWMEDIKNIGKGRIATELKWLGERDNEKKTKTQKENEVWEMVGDKITEEIIESGVEITAELIGNRLLKATVSVLVPAWGLLGIIMLPFELYELLELLKSVREPSKREPTQWEKQSAEIVQDVKSWLNRKQKAAEFEESLKNPNYFRTAPYNPKDGILRK